MIITKHAKKRLKERLGLKPRAAQRHAITAFKSGIIAIEHPDKRIALWFRGEQSRKQDLVFIIYREMVYLFGLCDDKITPRLVTVYPVEASQLLS